MATDKKTHKNRKSRLDKEKMWDLFPSHPKQTMECVFRAEGQRDTCDCCGKPVACDDDGFLVCTNLSCGIIYKDVMNDGAEWRYYGANDNGTDDPTRCGMPINPLLKESSFGCKVLCGGRPSYEMRKIKRYTEWQAMPYKEKSQYDEFQKITIYANQAGIPKLIIDDAMRYHKKISEAKTFRGLNRHGIIAASIYISARINNFPRTAKEIATIFNLDNTSATKGCKNAIEIINNMERNMEQTDKTTLFHTTPDAFIDRYCSGLHMNSELSKLCKFVSFRIQQNSLIPENTPNSIAAGIIYFIAQQCNVSLSKHAVYEVSGISEVTINKCYKKLEALKEQLIPKVILDKYK
jgi:transcription initiation factor TFIIB